MSIYYYPHHLSLQHYKFSNNNTIYIYSYLCSSKCTTCEYSCCINERRNKRTSIDWTFIMMLHAAISFSVWIISAVAWCTCNSHISVMMLEDRREWGMHVICPWGCVKCGTDTFCKGCRCCFNKKHNTITLHSILCNVCCIYVRSFVCLAYLSVGCLMNDCWLHLLVGRFHTVFWLWKWCCCFRHCHLLLLI